MIRKLILAATLGVSLAACSASQVTSITTTLLTDVDNAVIAACSAFPSVDSIIALLNTGVAATAQALATAFCSAFQTATPSPVPAPGPAPAALVAKKAGGAPIAYFCTPNGICGWK
jgi:hypothetical protein